MTTHRHRRGGLSHTQKAALCIMARETFESVPSTTLDFTAWRREEQYAAVGKMSLCDCGQLDYLPLKAHFENLRGRSGSAFETLVRDSHSEAAIAMHKLREACEGAGVRIEYAAAICRVQYRCPLDEATAQQLWQLVFTVRNRKRSESGKQEKRKVEVPF